MTVQSVADSLRIADTAAWFNVGGEMRCISPDGTGQMLSAPPEGGLVRVYDGRGGLVDAGIIVGEFWRNRQLAGEHAMSPQFVRERMNEAQREALRELCERNGGTFDELSFRPVFDLPKGWVAGWAGSLYVGCDPNGRISS